MKQYNFIHYTDWCDYHPILDAHANLDDNIRVTFIHDTTIIRNTILKNLLRVQDYLKVGRLFPGFITFLNWWQAKYYIPSNVTPSDTCMIYSSLYANYIRLPYFEYLKKQGYKLVLVYVDKLSLTPNLMNINTLKNYFDLICTYNEEESEQYNIEIHPIKMPDLSYLRNNEIYTDVFFIGSEKGRIKEINRIYDICSGLGLKCDFNVAGYQGNDHRDGIHYIARIPYEDMLNRVSHSKAVINLMQPGARGVTIRDLEASNLGIYMITDNKDIHLRTLYNEQQIIMLDDSDLKMKLSKIKTAYNRFNRPLKEYSNNTFYKWINEKIQ